MTVSPRRKLRMQAGRRSRMLHTIIVEDMAVAGPGTGITTIKITVTGFLTLIYPRKQLPAFWTIPTKAMD